MDTAKEELSIQIGDLGHGDGGWWMVTQKRWKDLPFHNHAREKWPYCKGNDRLGFKPILHGTMIMGGRVKHDDYFTSFNLDRFFLWLGHTGGSLTLMNWHSQKSGRFN